MLTDPLNTPPAEQGKTPVVSLVGTKRVSNQIPRSVTVPYRLAIIGEAPGEDEENYGQPFVGASGKMLEEVLSATGIRRDQIFLGNVCQFRPPGNKIDAWGHSHPNVQNGLADLRQQLRDWQPNCVLALGNYAMWALTGKPFGYKKSTHSISDYACFITPSNLELSPGRNVKLVGSYHPAYILRDYKNKIFLKFATMRAREEALTKDLVLPKRTFDLDLSAREMCDRLDNWPAGLLCSLDIEGGLQGWICISFVPSPETGFTIAFSQFSLDDQARLYRSISRILFRIDVPKLMQNSLYEGFVLQYGFNMVIRNVDEDTMLKWWEIYCELPKSLDTQASICTREPQWKFLIAYSKTEQKRRSKLPDFDPEKEKRNKYLACCIDSAVTLESCRVQDRMLSDMARRHYIFNLDLLSAVRYMELRGFNYDLAAAREELAATLAQKRDCSERLRLRAGYDLTGEKGSISAQKLARCLYEEKNYPVQKDGRGPTAKVTTDVEAILTLQYKFPNDPFLADVLLHRKLEGLCETLSSTTDPDGRVRCAYNLVGTETGRLSCYTSPTGSGGNLQTITKKLRRLYRADDGFWLFQCDLSGADGWTVAARCLSLGDPVMWDDYRAGLKPAKILAMMYHHGVESTMCDRMELKARCDEESKPGGCCDQDSWLYFAAKRCQHATNYKVMPKTMVTQIMQDSYKVSGKPIYISLRDATQLQKYYLMRYVGVESYHTWGGRITMDGKNVTAASGSERRFFGRRRQFDWKTKEWGPDHDTWKEVLAHEPQHNTTYATLLAVKRLWDDQENREADGRRLKIQPIHTVHDALNGLFPKSLSEWAPGKIKSYFDNEMTIAGIKVTIPFEGAYGPNWFELGPKYGGGNI